MILGTRRQALAAGVTVLAAVAVAVAVAGRGCRGDENSPEGAVRALIAAIRVGDRKAVFELLGPETRHRLDDAAHRTSELVGGARRYEPIDLVSIAEPAPEVTAVVLRQRDGDRAVVDVEDEQGERHALTVVEVDGAWRVEVPAAAP